ncbi:MAG: hypothetical protein JO363_05230 [Solirubrobacterales bacterium]|nr:hypothetical protein [Solirubrobacterales bacterium]
MWKSPITAIAGVTAALLATTAFAASPAGAVTKNGPGVCTPSGCTCTPTTCQPIQKPAPKPYPISSCFSINATPDPIGERQFTNELTVQGQCFAADSTADVSVTKDVTGLPTTTYDVPVAADGTFTATFVLPADAAGTYNIWAADYIGPGWLSPTSNQVSLKFP